MTFFWTGHFLVCITAIKTTTIYAEGYMAAEYTVARGVGVDIVCVVCLIYLGEKGEGSQVQG